MQTSQPWKSRSASSHQAQESLNLEDTVLAAVKLAEDDDDVETEVDNIIKEQQDSVAALGGAVDTLAANS